MKKKSSELKKEKTTSIRINPEVMGKLAEVGITPQKIIDAYVNKVAVVQKDGTLKLRGQ